MRDENQASATLKHGQGICSNQLFFFLPTATFKNCADRDFVGKLGDTSSHQWRPFEAGHRDDDGARSARHQLARFCGECLVQGHLDQTIGRTRQCLGERVEVPRVKIVVDIVFSHNRQTPCARERAGARTPSDQ